MCEYNMSTENIQSNYTEISLIAWGEVPAKAMNDYDEQKD